MIDIQPVAGCVIDNGRYCDPFMAREVLNPDVWDDPDTMKLYDQPAIDALRAEVELLRSVIDAAPRCRLLEVQCSGFDDPDRPVLDWMVKSGKRFAIIDTGALGEPGK